MLYIKALHIIGVVAWFAGLFYLVRLFIYHAEAEEKLEEERRILQDQFKIMEHRLWKIITVPSAWAVVITGFYMVYQLNYWTQPWMMVKFGLVIGLLIYHFKCGKIVNQLQKDEIPYTSKKLRLFNELATLFLFSIVFVVVLKTTMDWVKGIAGFITIALILFAGIKIYRNRLKK